MEGHNVPRLEQIIRLAIKNGSLVQRPLHANGNPDNLGADLHASLPAIPDPGDASEDLVLANHGENRAPGVAIQRQLAEQGKGLVNAVKEQ
ncbi:hypothetical protein DUNSADRAFT_5667, partial [Dunaliella salina]